MNITLTFFLLLFSINCFAADLAAHVTSVKGQAWVHKMDEPRRPLQAGDTVYEAETVSTGKKSSLKLLFLDGSKFDLGEATTLEISHYQYQTPNHPDSFSSRIFKGTFRFVTGLIANDNPRAMDVNLPVATIGIRGTHVVGETNSTTAKVILLKPEKSVQTSVEVFNQFGSVTIDKVGYGTEIPDEFSPPSPVRRMQLRTIDNLIRSIQRSQRIRIPRPR
ncbi:hypothetical protein A9Q79_06535 [Methylophaga sp. 42_25_T18]|nr:hypothetical protein A9Q79_06535 [Methylophaga sp. 42_25_T18]OUR89113.1 hypothetical protein A9Q92_01560 [Methylophaga sp. 42_8_T64]